VRSVAQLLRTKPTATEAILITRDRDSGENEPYQGLSGCWNRWSTAADVFYLDVRSIRQCVRLVRTIRRRHIDVLYLNSFWDPIFTAVPLLLLRFRIVRVRTVLLAPRGQLSAGAMSIHHRKKAMLLSLWMRFIRGAHPLWHASTQLEGDEIKRIDPAADVIVSINPAARQELAEPTIPVPVDLPKLVFISRITPKKNLLLALMALRHLSRPVDFDIYGPVEDPRYWSRCEYLIEQMPAHVNVRYRGPLPHKMVGATFNAYDFFVFPTLGENFGHVIAESLGASCPVICTDTTPWSAVLRSGGGIVLPEISYESILAALERVAALSAAERVECRKQAAGAYRHWRAIPTEPHIFELVHARLELQAQ
jgi:glycosyltransferase involved in cell wall biosynthesis